LKRPGFRHRDQPTLAVDVTDPTAVTEVAWIVARFDRPGVYRLFNIDLHREFRYCLEEGISPVPSRGLRLCELAIPTD
jgi:DNA polymerase I